MPLGIIKTMRRNLQEDVMGTYKVIEIIGTSPNSWEEAAKNAVEQAAHSLEDLRVAEIISQDLKIENGKVTAYRTKISVSFKFKEGHH
jgi:dodecin